jgi:methionine-rich copper-binding protein CopC
MRTLTIVVSLVFVALQISSAQAHAFLDHSSPLVGSTVPSAPRQLTMWFTQNLEPAFSSAQVTGPNGARVDTGKARISANTMRVGLRPSGPGTYRPRHFRCPLRGLSRHTRARREDERWNLIDFIHANADALRLREAAGRITGFGYPLPSFSIECRDGTDWSTDQLKGRILHLSFVGPHSAHALLAKSAFADKNAINIIVPSDSEISDSSVCTTGDSSVRRLSAIYRASTNGDGGDTQWLVDAEGALRAIWWLGQGEPWTNAQVLQRRLNALERIPAVVRSSGGGHAHHH